LAILKNTPMTLFPGARQSTHRVRRGEDGYILLTLLLLVALMAITAAAILPTLSFEIRRDREQEMIHRGVQYSRAIRTYYKKFGRYPTRLEDLDNTNNLRFLRKRYKDPLNKNQDFKLLHFGEPGVTLGGGLSIPGGTIPGANPVGSPNGLNGSGPGGPGFGGPGFGSSASNSSGVNSSGVFSQSSGPGGSSNSGVGASSNSQTPPGQQGTNSASGSDPTQASSQVRGTGQGDESSSSQQLVTGGPIVGVASVSKKSTIREFNKKKKYNEWQFVYDPANDRGSLITTPNQPSLQGFGTQPGLNSTQPGSSNGGQFGQPTGLSNNPNPVAPPAQPPSNPPQPQ
jgi:type II secretory pathway pseudopilin PulG